MLYYFSGTGNSLRVACHLAEALGDRLSPMTSPQLTGCRDESESSVGLVFPVYAWGIPGPVETFVREHLSSVLKAQDGTYLYAVMTCGDDVGYADRVLDDVMRRSCGRGLDAAFSVQMPNTYVCLPGFDVDSDEVMSAKLSGEAGAVRKIASLVASRASVRCLVRGSFPRIKTYMLRPLFNHFLLTAKYFVVDASRCTSCGKCVRSCPVANIEMSGGNPVWQSHCAGCLACYHACPHHAINFGRMTQYKGQYFQSTSK